MIKLAALGDLHCPKGFKIIQPAFEKVNEKADFLILAGDLTSTGTLDEAYCLVKELEPVKIPVVAVLGNHEFHHRKQNQIKKILSENRIHLLDGTNVTFEVNGQSVGFTGTKGFCGGFGRFQIPDFGEPSLKALVDELEQEANKIKTGLRKLTAKYKIVVMHYCPTRGTLGQENKEIYYFLGGSKLAEPIDELRADMVFHGHCHFGVEEGETPGGIPVKNVALPLIKKPFALYELP